MHDSLARSIVRSIFICRVLSAYHCPFQDICSHLPSVSSLSFLFLSLTHRRNHARLFVLQNTLCTPYSLHCPMWGWYWRGEGEIGGGRLRCLVKPLGDRVMHTASSSADLPSDGYEWWISCFPYFHVTISLRCIQMWRVRGKARNMSRLIKIVTVFIVTIVSD